MAQARFVLVVAVAAALSGCTTIEKTVGYYFRDKPPTQAAAPVGTFFAGSDGLPVHADPSGSARVLGRLALYERVTRSRVESGYAYVVADQSGLTGWVDNGQLLWRLPTGDAPTGPASAPAAAAGTTSKSRSAGGAAQQPDAPAATDDAPDAPAPVAVPPPPAPVATPEPAPTSAPAATATAKKATPEMFDPY